MAAILTNGVLKIRIAPIFQPLLARRATRALSASHGAAQHAAPQCACRLAPMNPPNPNPSSFHTARTAPTFLNSQKNQALMLRAGGPGPGTGFLLPVPLRVGRGAWRRVGD